jgi:hypothetical protein
MSRLPRLSKAHPGALQVGDRFHLVKNLTDRAQQALLKIFHGRIAIPITDQTQQLRRRMELATPQQRAAWVKQLRKSGHSQEQISRMTAISMKTVAKYLAKSDVETTVEQSTARVRDAVGTSYFGRLTL